LTDFSTVIVNVEGAEVSMAPLADIFETAGRDSRDVAEVMIDALERDIWPEPLVRNHPTLSAGEQVRLLKARAAVIGLGGLGGHLAMLMARAGLGHLVLADGDSFDVSNLNRQILCTSETIGENKAAVASRQCRMANPAVKTYVWETDFTEANGREILAGVDVVLDGLDKIPSRKTVFESARALNIPFIHGAVQRWSGQTSTFLPDTPATLDSVYPGGKYESSPPSVLAPVVSLIASIQAQEAIRLLTGRTPANTGRLIFIDGEDLSLHKIKLAR